MSQSAHRSQSRINISVLHTSSPKPGWRFNTCCKMFIICMFFSTVAHSAQQTEYYKKTTIKLLSDIVDDAEFAITERNFRIVNRLHIGKAIRDRGYPDYPDYEVLLFCNLNYARQLFDMEPDFINFCPIKITIRDNGENYLITATLFPQDTDNVALNKLATKVNNLIRDIVEFAAADWFVIYD